MFCSRLELDDGDIPDEGTGLLRLQRDMLVNQIISAAEGKKKHVLLRGAAGTGKTSLLAHVARKLEAQTKRVLVAANPSMLPNLETLIVLGWQSDLKIKPKVASTSPLYLLIDEAQQSYGRGVLQALLKVPAKNRNIIIVKVLQIKQMKVKSNLFHTTMGKKHNMITVNPLMDQLWKLRENVVCETTVQLQLRQTHKQFSQTTLKCSINLNISNK